MGIDLNGSGTFYFLGQEGVYIPAGVGEIGIIYENTVLEDSDETVADLLFNREAFATASFEVMGKIGFEAWMALTGLRDVCLSLCPNKKVVHLAKYATKKKVKKKNLRRAIRILEGKND